jgi:exodeoxyribonuclease V alpha subunit
MDVRIYGVIHKVRYFKEETGFGIVRIKLDYNDPYIRTFQEKLYSSFLAVTCNFDRLPLIEEEYEFIGEFVDTDYGLQLKAKQFSRTNEYTTEGLITFLSSDFFPSIGKVTAKKIVLALGENCLSKIAEDKKVLHKVKGLTAAQKSIIYENVVSNQANKQAMLKLLSLGVTMQMSNKLIQQLGLNAYEIIATNPYVLIERVEGIGFHRADRIAMEMGIQKDDPKRIEALAMYLIDRYSYSSGNVYITKNDLLEAMMRELEEGFNQKFFDDALVSLEQKRSIHIDQEGDIYHNRIYRAENLLAERIQSLLQAEFSYGYELESVGKGLDHLREAVAIEYSLKQLEAIEQALSQNITIITGGPGTGKSTVIKGIVEAYVHLHKQPDIVRSSVSLLAPTGRAAKRLKEVTGHDAMTIHRFLGFEGNGRFRHGPEAPVDCKMLIVDEFSMVDVELAARLFSAIYPFTKVVIVGDADQLPSVGPGDVLNDLIASKKIPIVQLDKIHRQAENSSIVALAHMMNKGKLPNDLMDKKADRTFIPMSDASIVTNIVRTVQQAQEKGMDLVKDIQVLVPIYKGDVGIDALNQKMQEVFNPAREEQLQHTHRYFRVNDKVIQLVNRSDKQVMNGDIGYVWRLDYHDGSYIGLEVMFDFGSVYYKKDELEDLMHAYAISIHKAQGSEFDLAVIPFTNKHFIMLKRKLIYTAITRAKRYLIMLGNVEALRRGIMGVEDKRKSKLMDKLGVPSNEFSFDDLVLEDSEAKSPYDFMD